MFEKFHMCKDQSGFGLKDVAGSRYYKTLKISAIASFCLMLCAQIFMVFWFTGEQYSDSELYLTLAQQCAENGLWYPSAEHLYKPFIAANGVVNFLALVLRFTSNMRVLYAINMVYVQMTLWSCLYIIKKAFKRNTVCFWFVIIFCLLNTCWSDVVQIMSELPFNALVFLGLALLYSGKKWSYPAGGVVLALANWVRPIALAFLVGAVCVLIVRNKKFRHLLSVVGSYAAVIVLIGSISFVNCGHFVYQAVTFGYNFIMTANDDADGSYMNLIGEGQAAYIPPEQKETMTFMDYNDYYVDLSLEWIKENPGDYLKQIPAKLFYLYGTETYSGIAYFNNEQATSGMRYIKSVADKFTGDSDVPIHIGDILIILDQIWYMMIVVLFLFGTVFCFKKKQWRGMIPLWASMFCGTGITLVVVGAARYHAPFVPIMMACAAFACECIFAGKKRKYSR